MLPVAAAQPTPPSQSVFPADTIDLARLIDLCSQRLTLNIDYDPAALKGATITLRLGSGMSDAELWALTNRLLVSRGFTTVRMAGDGGAISVVKTAEAASLARIEEDDQVDPQGALPVAPRADPGPGIPGGPPGFQPPVPRQAAFPPGTAATQAGFRSIVIRARHRPAKELADAIKPFLSRQGTTQTGSVTVVEVGAGTSAAGNTSGREGAGGASSPGFSGASAAAAPGGLMILSDLAPRLEQAQRMLELLDVPADRTIVEEMPLNHLGGGQMVALATQVASKQAAISSRKIAGEVLPSPNGGAVLLLAPESHLQYWRDLVAQLDQREPVETANYSPRYFGLKEVASLLEQTVRDAPGAAGAVGRGGAAAAPDDRLRLVIDDLTGTLIVTATPSQHERIAALITRLDSVSPAARRPVKTFVLKNRPVQDVVGVIQDLLHVGALEGEVDGSQDGSSDEGGPRRATAAGDAPRERESQSRREPAILAGGSAASVPAPIPPDPARPRRSGSSSAAPFGLSSSSPQAGSQSLSLTADEQTNTLIAVGEPRALAQLETLLATIDVRQPQVMLEVLLLSLTDTQTLALGLELEKLTKAGDAQIRLSSLFGLSVINAGSSTTVPGGIGGTVTVLSPGEFSILVRALETLNEGRSLSMPKLLVGNNQAGNFSSVAQQPVTTTVTPSSQVTTTTFGGYEQAGTTVSVQPRIAEGDHLGLKYTVTLSAFTGTGSGGLPPPKQSNTISSDVLIPDAYTVALGGIDLVTTGEGTSQIPFLGDIPIIGEVFKSRNNSNNRTRFYVFIRAEVMRSTSFEDLKYASDQTTREAEIDDGFPQMEPLLIR